MLEYFVGSSSLLFVCECRSDGARWLFRYLDVDGDGRLSKDEFAQGASAVEGAEFQRVRYYCLNPKSITSGQLYGDFDENTHENVDIKLDTLRAIWRKLFRLLWRITTTTKIDSSKFVIFDKEANVSSLVGYETGQLFYFYDSREDIIKVFDSVLYDVFLIVFIK